MPFIIITAIDLTYLIISKFQPMTGMYAFDSSGSENPIDLSSSDHFRLFKAVSASMFTEGKQDTTRKKL